MITVLTSWVDEAAVEADVPRKGLKQHVGSSMKPGARLGIWSSWERLGVLECKVLTETCLEFRADGRFLGRAFNVLGKLDLEPRGGCMIELGDLRDPNVRCCFQHRRAVLISEGLGGDAPSLRFWAAGAETKLELRCTTGRSRPRFDLTIASPRS